MVTEPIFSTVGVLKSPTRFYTAKTKHEKKSCLLLSMLFLDSFRSVCASTGRSAGGRGVRRDSRRRGGVEVDRASQCLTVAGRRLAGEGLLRCGRNAFLDAHRAVIIRDTFGLPQADASGRVLEARPDSLRRSRKSRDQHSRDGYGRRE